MLKEIFIAIRSFKLAHTFIREKNLLKWVLIPGILYAGFFYYFLFYFLASYNASTNWLFETLHLQQRFSYLQDTVWQFLFITGKVFFDILLLLACFSFYKSFFLLFASPLFVFLSSKISHPEFSLTDITRDSIKRDMWRGFWVSFRTGLWAIVFMISLLLIAVVPLIGWFTPLLFFVIDMYYTGTDMLAYAKIGMGKMDKAPAFIFPEHKGLAIGTGLLFYAMHFIPVVGWVFATGYAVVAATLGLQKISNNQTAITE